jgi:uncharacterized membrane protein YhhN
MHLPTAPALRRAYAGLAVIDSVLAGSDLALARHARLVTKPLLMPTLAGSLLSDPLARRSPLRTTTLIAQLGGWGGDLALLKHGTTPFVVGAGSFAVGHASYLTGFRRNGRPLPQAVRATAPRAIAATWLISGPVLAVAASRHEKTLGPAVLGYSAFLATMAAAATQLRPGIPPTARRATASGAALFMLSDTVLGVRKFLLHGDNRRLESLVMATYTTGQLLLSEGAARAGR